MTTGAIWAVVAEAAPLRRAKTVDGKLLARLVVGRYGRDRSNRS